MAASVNNSCC